MVFRITFLLSVSIFHLSYLSSQCSLEVDLGENILACSEDETRLSAIVKGRPLDYTWTPANRLVGPNSTSPRVVVDPNASQVFGVTVRGFDPENNLIKNPSFEDGDEGFTSQYASGSTAPGGYIISTTSTDLVSEGPECTDHTSGDGNMLLAKVSNSQDVAIYCAEVSVRSNTNYHFRAFATVLKPNLPPAIIISINGVELTFGTLGTVACSWTEVQVDWASGGEETAVICIRVSPEDVGLGTDFALDDLGFYEICSGSDQVDFQSVALRITGPTEFDLPCNEEIEIGIGVDGPAQGVAYRWITEEGQFTTSVFQATVGVNLPALYGVTVEWNNTLVSCRDTARIVVTSELDQDIDLQEMSAGTCDDPTVLLSTANAIPDSLEYFWSTENGMIMGDPTATTIEALTSGTYQLTLANKKNTCTTSELIITEFSISGDLSYEVTSPDCIRDLRSIVFNNDDQPDAEFSIDGGAQYFLQTEFTDLSPDTYFLSLRDPSGCELRDTVTFDPVVPIRVSLPEEVTNDGMPLTLDPTINLPLDEIASIVWSPAAPLSCADCIDPVLPSGVDGAFQIVLTDVQGCRDSALVMVTTDNVSLLYMPNAFTPNGDQVNDVVLPGFHPRVTRVNSWQIFNRQGGLVFERSDFSAGAESWNGKSGDDDLEAGVYVSLINFEMSGGESHQEVHTIALIR